MPASSQPLLALVLLFVVAGCATAPAKYPAAERPRPREHVTLEYANTDGERRPVDIAYFVVLGLKTP